MYVEYGTACATSASGVHNLGGGVRGVRKSSVRISPLPDAGGDAAVDEAAGRRRGRLRGQDPREGSQDAAPDEVA